MAVSFIEAAPFLVRNQPILFMSCQKFFTFSRPAVVAGMIHATALLSHAGLPEPASAPVADSFTDDSMHLFKAGEVFVDLYGTVVGGTDFRPDVSGGGGVGAGYFFNRFFGVMAEAYLLDLPGYHGSAAGGFIVRLPVDDYCTAFYGFAEAGADFSDETRLSLQFGGGLDIRMTDHVSLFTDARSVFSDSSKVDTAWLFRGGVRFVF